MPASSTRYLLGPDLLLGLCLQRTHAIQWADRVSAQDCFISNLSVALVQSVIDTDADDADHRDEWLRALERLKSRYVVEGGTLIDVTAHALDRWRDGRTRSPLQFETDEGLAEVEQDVRLLLASADALGLTYVEYEARYLHQAASRGLAVEVIAQEDPDAA